jgi:SAM-dependent methyltransferase
VADEPAPSAIEVRTAVDCRICGRRVEIVGKRYGEYARRPFTLGRCPSCGFACVTDPWLDYEAIYNEDYYQGRGADPHVDYLSALSEPAMATQRYEWRGIQRRLQSLSALQEATPWLDYGCGVGGLVQYLRGKGFSAAFGFEQGWSEKRLEERSVPHLRADDLDANQERFDVVTAIEVLEHSIDPVGELRRIRALMKPGGILFVTTGNARPYRDRLSRWRYITPEVHISFFEPDTLARAMRAAGFEPRSPGFGPGWADLYRAKVLRTLGIHRVNWAERMVPWGMVARALEAKLGLAEHPIGVAV